VTQQLIREYTYAFSAVCPQTGILFSLIMPYADSQAMNIFLKLLSAQQQNERIIICMDKAGWHTTNHLEVPKNIILWFLPPYSPELNPVELIWRELRAKYFNNKTFNTLNDVDAHLEYALKDFCKDKELIKNLTRISYL
jgi:transposase